MFYGDTIQDTRQLFFSSWQKFNNQLPLSPLEHEIAQVVLAHPEYHSLLAHPEQYQDVSYFPELGETNPFLHMGLHIAVREQIKTDRPQGISELFNALMKQHTDPLEIEHLIMEQLAECLWLAQKNTTYPDEQLYLSQIKALLNKN